jgi:hypothetical protein
MGVQFNVKIVPFSHPFILMYYLFLFLWNSNGLIHFNMCEALLCGMATMACLDDHFVQVKRTLQRNISGRNVPHNVSVGLTYVTMCEYRARRVVYNEYLGPLFIILIIFS